MGIRRREDQARGGKETIHVSKLLLRKLIRGWGMFFRALFICSVGLVAYFWLDPLSIKDVPFAKLTLRQVVKFFSAAGIILYCAVWFFDFPKQIRDNDAYDRWALLSVFFIPALSALWI